MDSIRDDLNKLCDEIARCEYLIAKSRGESGYDIGGMISAVLDQNALTMRILKGLLSREYDAFVQSEKPLD